MVEMPANIKESLDHVSCYSRNTRIEKYTHTQITHTHGNKASADAQCDENVLQCTKMLPAVSHSFPFLKQSTS